MMMLTGRGLCTTSADVSANEMHHFFDVKVDGVRASTSDAPPPSVTAVPLGCVLHVFRRLSVSASAWTTALVVPSTTRSAGPLLTDPVYNDVINVPIKIKK